MTWTREDAANLSIIWHEIGGPAVAASPDCKYGVSIIRSLIANEVGGAVDLVFASSGVCCKIEIPLKEPVSGERTGKFPFAMFGFEPGEGLPR